MTEELKAEDHLESSTKAGIADVHQLGVDIQEMKEIFGSFIVI